MNTCIIVAPLYAGEEKEWTEKQEGDFLICADGGLERAEQYGISPDLVIGDFDSMRNEMHATNAETIRLPVHKDDTDMLACIKEGMKRGYRSFRMLGCLGGRFDHSVSNLQTLYYCAENHCVAWMADRQNRVTVLLPGTYHLDNSGFRFLSLLAFTPEVTGIDLTGCIWDLQNASIRQDYPIGCSNETLNGKAELSFKTGALTVIYSNG